MIKRVIRYISEIFFAFVLIFISYFAWDRIDVNAYEKQIKQYYSSDILIDMDNEFSELVYLTDEENVDNLVLYLNNYQDKEYSVDLLLILNDFNESFIDDLYLSVDSVKYNLRDIYLNSNSGEYYFLIKNVKMLPYEKKDYNLKLLADNDFDFNNFEGFSYKIEEKIIG